MRDSILRAALAVAQTVAARLLLVAVVRLWRRGGRVETDTVYMTTTEAAEQLGLTQRQVTRIYERGFLSPAPRIGNRRVIARADLEQLRAAAVRAGYLTA